MSDTMTAGAVLLARLRALGVDYIFANSGTDFPPIIEGLAEAAAKKVPLPVALTMPHEHAAMGMAYGYYMATGRAQAVMAHTNVGLANCAIGAINAATEHVPVLLFSGRTPVLESGRLGARTVPIGWGQEMRDQAALVREATKWDYEIRFPEQALEMADRAHAIATSTPKGPVYLSLPREVLCQPCPSDGVGAAPGFAAARSVPPQEAIDEAARLLASAQRPVILAQRGAGSAEAFAALQALVNDWGIPVSHYWALQLALPTAHPMCASSDPHPWLAEADVVLVIDALAPWSPAVQMPPPGCRVIHAGPDPLYSRVPVRNFPSHLSLAGETADIILALAKAMAPLHPANRAACRARHAAVAARTGTIRQRNIARAEEGRQGTMTKAWVARCLSDAIRGRAATVLSELGCPLDFMELDRHGSWYQEPHSGGLGWSFPTALGMQLADRDHLIVATMGDGSYMFANPVACHQIAEALELPVLLLVLNNAEWGAVRQSVLGLYPGGYAAKANTVPLTSLQPVPDFTKVAEASRAWARRVEQGDELPAALAEAIRQVTEQRRHALLDIRISA